MMMQSIALLLVCLIAAAQAFIAAPAAVRADTAQNMFGMGKGDCCDAYRTPHMQQLR
jgi:hypothetical protein